MKYFLCLPLALLLGGNALANPDYTKRTAKKCAYCHTGDWTSGKYTDAGQYFKIRNSFGGYAPKTIAPPQQTPGAASTQKTIPKT